MSTIRPNNSNSNQSGLTVRPNCVGTDINSTTRPGIGGTTNSSANQSTIRPGTNKSTVRPDTSNLNGSTADFDTTSQTTRPKSSNNVTSSMSDKVDINMYQPRSSYIIDGVAYNVVKALSLTSGEAQVFLVEDSRLNKHVLKLYYRGATPAVSILNKVKSVNKASVHFLKQPHYAFSARNLWIGE